MAADLRRSKFVKVISMRRYESSGEWPAKPS